jgi:hypothetical protein
LHTRNTTTKTGFISNTSMHASFHTSNLTWCCVFCVAALMACRHQCTCHRQQPDPIHGT